MTLAAPAPATTSCDAAETTLAALAPIGLEELNAQAALLQRVDRKYIVPRALLPQLYAAAAAGSRGDLRSARALDINGSRVAAYASIYFDTPERELYLAAAHKRRRRAKVRTRHYLDSSLAFLEVKTRGPRGSTIKQRVPLAVDDGTRLGAEAEAFLGHTLQGAGIPTGVVGRLAPVLGSAYGRSTLYLPHDGARVTVDTALRWSLFQPDGSPVLGTETAFPGQAIVETKSSSTPSSVDRWLWAMGQRPAQISKFATGLAVLEPQLPHNKWHRTLSRHYPQTP